MSGAGCKSNYDSSITLAPLTNMIMRKKVDLYIQAHLHTYYRSKQLTVKPAGQGCDYIVNESNSSVTYNANCIADGSADNIYDKGAGTVIPIIGTGGMGLSVPSGGYLSGYFASSLGKNNTGATHGVGKFTVSDSEISYSFERASWEYRDKSTYTDTFKIVDKSKPSTTSQATITPSQSTIPMPTNKTTLNAVEDTYVSNETTAIANTNYGTSTTLYADGNPIKQTFLKFNAASMVNKTLTSARLKFRTTDADTAGSPYEQNIKIVEDTTWKESLMTYNNKPVLSAKIIGNTLDTVPGSDYDIELDTATLQQYMGKIFSMGIDTSGDDGLYLLSKETTSPPQLILEYAPATCEKTFPIRTGTATLTTSVATAGTYRLWSRIMPLDDQSNSYWLQVDNECPVNVGDITDETKLPKNQWSWVDYKDGDINSKINLQLSAGVHTLKFVSKEEGVNGGLKIDKILLSKDQACVPINFGENCASVTACPKKINGDANCDNSIDLIDFEQFRSEFIKFRLNQLDITEALADFNSDKSIDLIDFELFRQGFINQRASGQ